MRVLLILLMIVSCFVFVVVAQAATAESHAAKATVKPTLLNHKHVSWGSCRCLMCLGQHLRNWHGERSNRLDAIGYRNWVRYHKQVHATGLYKPPKPRTTCPGGVCGPPRGRIIYRLFSRWRR